jgi:hypothetical protein
MFQDDFYADFCMDLYSMVSRAACLPASKRQRLQQISSTVTQKDKDANTTSDTAEKKLLIL